MIVEEIEVILPCLDEAAALSWVLGRMPPGFRPLVADNGSADGSPEIARELGATVVTAEPRGYGAACHAGLLAATSDVVCVMDADASLDPRELPAAAAPVLAGELDLVLGRRRARERGAWPPHSRAANALIATLLRRRTARLGNPVALHDLGPLRVFRREAMLGLRLTDRRFGYPLETVLKAAAAGWRIGEVDVGYLPRRGRSKVTGTVRGTLRAARDMRRVLAA